MFTLLNSNLSDFLDPILFNYCQLVAKVELIVSALYDGDHKLLVKSWLNAIVLVKMRINFCLRQKANQANAGLPL